MTATYLSDMGRGKSLRAIEADRNGKAPMTASVKLLSHATGLKQKECRAILSKIGPCEWHHTGKYASCTDYYPWHAVGMAIQQAEFTGMGFFDTYYALDFINDGYNHMDSDFLYKQGKLEEAMRLNAKFNNVELIK